MLCRIHVSPLRASRRSERPIVTQRPHLASAHCIEQAENKLESALSATLAAPLRSKAAS